MTRALETLAALTLALACDHGPSEPRGTLPLKSASASAPTAAEALLRPAPPRKVNVVKYAMGTEVRVVAYTTSSMGEAEIQKAVDAAMEEIARIEKLMSGWQKDTDVGRVNASAGKPVRVSPDTFEVFEKAQWASQISGGAFDASFNAMADVWKFGDAAEDSPELPDPALVESRRALIDYRKIHLDEKAHTVEIEKGMRVGLGGIAKGYAVDRASAVLEAQGVQAFLFQAGGDLFGRRRKPDGHPWVSGIQDPRGPRGTYFATIQLEDHAFSTAGDYARAFVLNGKRYHHIIDPKTGYPATACRSVTVWAPTAFVADAVDDAVFVMGPERGLQLVESLPGVGAVIVAADNSVVISKRLKGKVVVTRQPTGGI